MNDVELVAIVKALDSEVVKNFLSPIAKELGLTLGTCGEIFRFYSEENFGKVFTKWAESRRRALTANEFKRIMPLLPLAATVSDDELQTRWAALLESAVTETESFLPSFGRTLSELTAEEAQFLDRLWTVVSEPNRYLSEHRPGREPLSYQTLIKTFDPSINTGVNAAEMEAFSSNMPFAQIENYKRLGHAELVIQDLERLGILTHEPVAESEHDMYQQIGAQRIPIGQGKTAIRFEYSITQYGVSFVRAVTIKAEK
jgi:abortive infection alpha-like protein